MTEEPVRSLYANLDNWPKIAALLGEAKEDEELYQILLNGNDGELVKALGERGIEENEVRAFKNEIKEWDDRLAARSWYMPPADILPPEGKPF